MTPPRDTGPIVRTPDGEVADGPTETSGWEWVADLRAEIAEARADAKTSRAKARDALAELAAIRHKVTRAEKIIYPGAGVILAGVVAVVKLAFFAGGESSAARQREVERVETRATVSSLQLATVPSLRAEIASLARTIADVQGELRAISRLGAVRVQGPAPRPLLPDGEP